jgi:hypothetical protein
MNNPQLCFENAQQRAANHNLFVRVISDLSKTKDPFGSLWTVWARMAGYWDKLG